MSDSIANAWLVAHGRDIPLRAGALVMAVLNITPDSFSDGGMFLDPGAAVAQGELLVRDGADILDIGGESTRPGSHPVPPAEQIRRVLPVIAQLRDRTNVPISIDTRSAQVAEAAIEAGAHIVNDISALRCDEALADVVAQRRAGLVLMHMQGSPETMQTDPHYDDVVADVRGFLAERAGFAMSAGIGRQQIVLDPGIGFGKRLDHNLRLMRHVDRLAELGFPVLVGPSRKRFIGELSGAPANERLPGTVAACLAVVARGAQIVRVHNPATVRQAIAVARAIENAT